MVKVAVVTRTKDRPSFLKRAIESVHGQEFADFKHYIVNDGGDKSELTNLVEELDAATKKKISIHHRPSASNAPDTIFNECIDLSESEYIVIHDDDDTWDPRFLSVAIIHLEENKDIGGAVLKTAKVTESIDENREITVKKTEPWLPNMKEVNLYAQCAENQLTPISFVFRRSAYKAVGKYDSSLAVCGDWEFGVRFLMKYDIDFIDPGYPLAYYHHRKYKKNSEGNTSFAGNDRHRYYTNKIINKYLRDELNKGVIGPGYIMNKVRYDNKNISRIVSKLLPSKVVNYLKKKY